MGCNIITNLMQEYASTVKSTDVGLPWEVHFKAKKQFETTDLKRIFQFCIYLLSEAVKTDPPYSDSMIQLMGHLLRITERVLTWGYVSPIHILLNAIKWFYLYYKLINRHHRYGGHSRIELAELKHDRWNHYRVHFT